MLCQLNISNRFKSLNFDERKKKISFIIYHYTETSNFIEAVNLLTDKKRKVSSHFLIDTDGSIYNLVDIKKRAWHAGESGWKNLQDINSRSVGIEIVYPGEKKQMRYKTKQIKSLVSKYMLSGNHVINWDGTDNKGTKVTSGIYIYQLTIPVNNLNKFCIFIYIYTFPICRLLVRITLE